jgi:flavodoxin
MSDVATHAAAGRILVAYYSRTGRTARVAQDIAAHTGGDIEHIQDPRHSIGCLGYLEAIRDAVRDAPARIQPITRRPSDYALTIIGTPVWAWKMTPAVRAYLRQTQQQLGRVAFFVTSGDTDVAKILPPMEAMAGVKAIASIGFNNRELNDKRLYEEKLRGFLATIGYSGTAPAMMNVNPGAFSGSVHVPISCSPVPMEHP